MPGNSITESDKKGQRCNGQRPSRRSVSVTGNAAVDLTLGCLTCLRDVRLLLANPFPDNACLAVVKSAFGEHALGFTQTTRLAFSEKLISTGSKFPRRHSTMLTAMARESMSGVKTVAA